MKSLLSPRFPFLPLLFFLNLSVNAQWVQSNGPWGASVQSLTAGSGVLFAKTNAGIFRTTNNGAVWEQVKDDSGQTFTGCVVTKGDVIFGSKYQGDFLRSTDKGATWIKIPSKIDYNDVISLVEINGSIYANTYSHDVFRSTDHCSTWTRIEKIGHLYGSTKVGNSIFAATGYTMVCSGDNGTTWDTCEYSGIPQGCTIEHLTAMGTTLLAAVIDYNTGLGNFYHSTDYGSSWTATNDGSHDLHVTSLLMKDDVLFFVGGMDGKAGVFRSLDNGATWTEVDSGMTRHNVGSLAICNGAIFAGAGMGGGVFRSTNYGATWTEISTGLFDLSIQSVAVSGSIIYAGTYYGDIFRSTDEGMSWIPVWRGHSNGSLRSFATCGTTILTDYDLGLLRSNDGGATWTYNRCDLPDSLRITGIAATGSGRILATADNNGKWGIYLSIDNGFTWSPVNCGSFYNPVISVSSYNPVNVIAACGETFFAGISDSGIFRSTDYGTTWFAANTGVPDKFRFYSLSTLGSDIFASGIPPIYGDARILLHSTDNGGNWSVINTTRQWYIASLIKSGSALVAAIWDDGVFLSNDNGKNWIAVDSGLPNYMIYSMAATEHTLFIPTDQGVWRRPLSELAGTTEARSQKPLCHPAPGMIIRAPDHGSSFASIEFSLSTSGNVAISVFNFAGRKIMSIANNRFGTGNHVLRWDTRGVPPGFYTVKMVSGSGSYVKAFPVLR